MPCGQEFTTTQKLFTHQELCTRDQQIVKLQAQVAVLQQELAGKSQTITMLKSELAHRPVWDPTDLGL